MSRPTPNIDEVFFAALECDSPEARAAYLDEVYGEDPELRRRVQRLLDAQSKLGSFLASPAAGSTVAASQPPADDVGQTVSVPVQTKEPATLPGSVIAGRYKLREAIGEGGMGTVYLAEQIQPVKRQVAVKLVKPGMDSRTVLARFESERQALALLDHPHIAKVFDAGTTEAGRPFFVMELVKGIPLTEFCDQHRLGLPERLTLFRQICSAVQHAHQKGIIHRDLKPTNILVESHDGVPVPKVIDFGLAKATSGLQLSEHSLFTAFGTVAGTPLYMAPEQAMFNALDIDTRADIYALGVILYELLTGSTPIRRETFRQAGMDEMLRLIREVEPPPPSSRISTSDTLPSIAATRQTVPAQLGRFLRGDLDWIVMKALAKERNRRYESAIALAQDIERFTNHEPVTAGPPSAAYRLRKFARKYRAALATAGAFALLLVLVTAASAALALWANRQRLRAFSAENSARQHQARAQEREEMAIDAVKRYGEVVRDTPALKVNPALSNLRATLLKEPQKFFRKLRDRLQADRDPTPSSLERLAAANHELGYLTAELGDRQDAIRTNAEALAIRLRLASEYPAVKEYQAALAKSYNAIGILQRETGQLSEALASLEKCLEIGQRLTRENPSVAEFQYSVARAHNSIGVLERGTGKPADAIVSQKRAHAIFDQLARDNPSETDYQRYLAGNYINMALLQNDTGQPAQALESASQARAIQERLVHENPSVAEFQSDLAMNHEIIGRIQSATGRRADALTSFQQARAIQERLARESPAVTEYQRQLCGTYNDIGNIQRATGHPAEAIESFEKARPILETFARENPSVVSFQHDLAVTFNNLGDLHRSNARLAEALAAHERARSIRQRLAHDNPSATDLNTALASSHNNIGTVLYDLGRLAEALASHENARAINERLAREHPTVTAYQNDLASNELNIGNAHRALSQPGEALKSYEKARAIRERLAREHPTITQFQYDLATTDTNIGLLQASLGRPAEALKSYERSRAIRERLANDNPKRPDFASDIAATLNNMATIVLARQQYEKGRELLKEGIHWQRKAVAAVPNHPPYQQLLTMLLTNLSRVAERLGRPDEAADAKRQLDELRKSDPKLAPYAAGGK